MKEEYQITNLKKKDVSSAVLLVRESLGELYVIPSIYRAKGITKFIQNETQNPLSPYQFFAIKGEQNKLLGFCEFRRIKDVAFLNMIVVHPSAKGSGIGTMLLDYCINHYKREMYTSIMLDVSYNNEMAYKWYILKGFKLKSTKYLSKLCVEGLTEGIFDVQILNYPQHIALTLTYGFSMLETFIKSDIFKFGVINDSLFLRGEWNDSLLSTMSFLGSRLGVSNLYVIDEKPLDNRGDLLDKIARMELNLSGLYKRG